MKNRLFTFLIILIVVAICIFNIINMFGGIELIEDLGGGSFLIGILKIPLCLWGGFQMIRAFYSILGKDMKLIAESFGSGILGSAAVVADIACSLLGIIFMLQYWALR